jgi:hypothetical protein
MKTQELISNIVGKVDKIKPGFADNFNQKISDFDATHFDQQFKQDGGAKFKKLIRDGKKSEAKKMRNMYKQMYRYQLLQQQLQMLYRMGYNMGPYQMMLNNYNTNTNTNTNTNPNQNIVMTGSTNPLVTTATTPVAFVPPVAPPRVAPVPVVPGLVAPVPVVPVPVVPGLVAPVPVVPGLVAPVPVVPGLVAPAPVVPAPVVPAPVVPAPVAPAALALRRVMARRPGLHLALGIPAPAAPAVALGGITISPFATYLVPGIRALGTTRRIF